MPINKSCPFNVGDRVVIRDWDDMAAEFGGGEYSITIGETGVCFVSGMRELCGRELIIRSITPRIRHGGRVVGYVVTFTKQFDWTFVDGMLVSADDYFCRGMDDTVDPEGYLGILMA